MSILKFRIFLSKLLPTLLIAVVLSGAAASRTAQETPLTYDNIKTALESTSSGLSVSQINSFVIQRVNQRGVDFALTSGTTKVLTGAGASQALIAAINANSPQSNQTATTKSGSEKPDAKFSRLWVEQNVERDGRNGMIIHPEFTVYNLKSVPLQLTIRFEDSSSRKLKTSNQNYSNKNGELALFKNFNPGYDAAVYEDWSIFVPYDEMTLPTGRHDLKIAADVFYPKGDLLKQLTLYDVTVVKAKPDRNAPRADLSKMWVEYGVTENGMPGMRVHMKLRTYNLKNTTCWIEIKFEKDNGDRLVPGSTLFTGRTGGVALSSELTPAHAVTVYNDISVFMPYKELNLKKGDYSLKMRADLSYPDGGLIQHLQFYDFNFSQP